MSRYFAEALKIVTKNNKLAKDRAEQAYRDAVNQDPLLYEIDRKINENSKKLVEFFGRSGEKVTVIEQNIASLRDELFSRMAKLGIDTDSFSPQFSCKKCSDTGFIRGKKCDCLKEHEKKLALAALGTKLPIGSTGFENFSTLVYPEECREQMTDIFEFCKAYADSFNFRSGSILMTGNTGLGKTHLSLAIVKSAIEKGFSPAYGSAQNFLAKIESEHFSRTDDRSDTLDTLLECQLLVLDDLGTEFSSPFINSTIYCIINTRLLASRPTIISTNLGLEELKKRYGDRIISRIMGSYDILKFEGRDIRVLKRIEEIKN